MFFKTTRLGEVGVWQNWHADAWKSWGKEEEGTTIETVSVKAEVVGLQSFCSAGWGALTSDFQACYSLKQFHLSHTCQLLKFQAFLPFCERSRKGLGGALSSSALCYKFTWAVISLFFYLNQSKTPPSPCPLLACSHHRLACFALDFILVFFPFLMPVYS